MPLGFIAPSGRGPHPRARWPPMIDYPSLATFRALVEHKDFRPSGQERIRPLPAQARRALPVRPSGAHGGLTARLFPLPATATAVRALGHEAAPPAPCAASVARGCTATAGRFPPRWPSFSPPRWQTPPCRTPAGASAGITAPRARPTRSRAPARRGGVLLSRVTVDFGHGGRAGFMADRGEPKSCVGHPEVIRRAFAFTQVLL